MLAAASLGSIRAASEVVSGSARSRSSAEVVEEYGAGGGGRTRTRFEPHGILSPHLSKSIGRHESRCSKSWLRFGSPSRGIEERQLPQRSRRIAHFGHNSATWGRNDGSAVTARDPCLKRAWLCTWGSDVGTGSPLGVTRQVQAPELKVLLDSRLSGRFDFLSAPSYDRSAYSLRNIGEGSGDRCRNGEAPRNRIRQRPLGRSEARSKAPRREESDVGKEFARAPQSVRPATERPGLEGLPRPPSEAGRSVVGRPTPMRSATRYSRPLAN